MWSSRNVLRVTPSLLNRRLSPESTGDLATQGRSVTLRVREDCLCGLRPKAEDRHAPPSLCGDNDGDLKRNITGAAALLAVLVAA